MCCLILKVVFNQTDPMFLCLPLTAAQLMSFYFPFNMYYYVNN